MWLTGTRASGVEAGRYDTIRILAELPDDRFVGALGSKTGVQQPIVVAFFVAERLDVIARRRIRSGESAVVAGNDADSHSDKDAVMESSGEVLD